MAQALRIETDSGRLWEPGVAAFFEVGGKGNVVDLSTDDGQNLLKLAFNHPLWMEIAEELEFTGCNPYQPDLLFVGGVPFKERAKTIYVNLKTREIIHLPEEKANDALAQALLQILGQ